MSELLRELVGHEVSAWTSPGLGHAGIVQNIGSRWMHLVSDTFGTLLIPLENIRLIKITGGGMTAQVAAGDLGPSMRGKTMSVSSRSGENSFSDSGVLEAFDDDWLRLQVKGSQLYFAVSSIILLRPV